VVSNILPTSDLSLICITARSGEDTPGYFSSLVMGVRPWEILTAVSAVILDKKPVSKI
jgi:hypothetical protein